MSTRRGRGGDNDSVTNKEQGLSTGSTHPVGNAGPAGDEARRHAVPTVENHVDTDSRSGVDQSRDVVLPPRGSSGVVAGQSAINNPQGAVDSGADAVRAALGRVRAAAMTLLQPFPQPPTAHPPLPFPSLSISLSLPLLPRLFSLQSIFPRP